MRSRWSEIARGQARLLACSNYTDSHAYVLHVSHARKIVAAHASLVEHGGRGSRRCESNPVGPRLVRLRLLYETVFCDRCVNPWGHVSCASDPGILRDFFKQCDRALPALHPSHDKLRCSGSETSRDEPRSSRDEPRSSRD